MTLKEKIKWILDEEYGASGLEESLVELFKKWALDLVGEDYPLDKDSSFAGLNELVGRNWEKQKIRQRIQKSIEGEK